MKAGSVEQNHAAAVRYGLSAGPCSYNLQSMSPPREAHAAERRDIGASSTIKIRVLPSVFIGGQYDTGVTRPLPGC